MGSHRLLAVHIAIVTYTSFRTAAEELNAIATENSNTEEPQEKTEEPQEKKGEPGGAWPKGTIAQGQGALEKAHYNEYNLLTSAHYIIGEDSEPSV